MSVNKIIHKHSGQNTVCPLMERWRAAMIQLISRYKSGQSLCRFDEKTINND